MNWVVGRKKDATILNTGIVCSRTIPASDVRGLFYDREFQRPPSFQPYIGSVAGELPRTLTISQGRKLTIFWERQNRKNFQKSVPNKFQLILWLQFMRKHSETIWYKSAQRFSSCQHLQFCHTKFDSTYTPYILNFQEPFATFDW